MVMLTDSAGALLHQMQREQHFPATLRVVAVEDGFVVDASAPAPDDEVLFHEGTPVLRLSAEVARALAGCTLTTQDSGEGPTLVILGPDAPAPSTG
jgi:hypothetical protein